MKGIILTLSAIIVFWQASCCQPGIEDTQKPSARTHGMLEAYKASNIAHILSGKNYALKQLYSINNQFFLDMNPTRGELMFDGIRFSKIEMLYDIATEQLVVLLKSRTNERYVSIDETKITFFSFDDRYFERIEADSIMEDGIYEHIFSGINSRLFIKRKKNKATTVTTDQIIVEFIPTNLYYLKNQFGTFQITNKKSLMNACNHSEQFAAALKTNKIRFTKKLFEQNLTKAVILFDSITTEN